MHPGGRESGQAAVETAIVMPMMVFLILGLLQLGLMTQARIMAKYAAYRAARVGAMNHANVDAMQAAAVLHLLPVLAGTNDVIRPSGSATEVLVKFPIAMAENTLVPGMEFVKVAICGPTQGELKGTNGDGINRADQQALYGTGSENEVDFDDPRLMVSRNVIEARPMREYNRTRLRVQVQFLYRMPIPFANWMITHIYLGTALPSVMHMGDQQELIQVYESSQPNQVRVAAAAGIYTVPINAGYAMRMQSNFFLDRHPLPEENECVHYGENVRYRR